MGKKSAKLRQIRKNNRLAKKRIKAKSKHKKRNVGINPKNNEKVNASFVDGTLIKNTDHKKKSEHQHIKDTFSDALNEYSPIDTASVFSSFLLNPEYQSNQYRFEKAIAISLSFCQGNKKPDKKLIQFVLAKLESMGVGHMEDPAEDMFISTVWFEGEQYKVSTGLWEGAVYQTQMFLDFISTSPNDKNDTYIKRRLLSILSVSDKIITQNNLRTHETGSREPHLNIDCEGMTDIDELVESVQFKSFSEASFLPSIDLDEMSGFYKQELGSSDMEASPFWVDVDNNCTLILPSSILITIRREIICFVRQNFGEATLDNLFYFAQAKRIKETKILREFDGLPIRFNKIKSVENWFGSEAIVEFDKGYFFHFIFIGESLKALDADWFNGVSDGGDNLATYIDTSISKAQTFVVDKSKGVKGCSIIVPCSFGKGLALGFNFQSNPQWMAMVVSAGDLNTISQDHDCEPHKIWRIIESHEQLSLMGVRFFNFSGFLNLYAFAKDNNYSLVSHESFQEKNGNLPTVIALPNNCHVDLRCQVSKDSEKLQINHYKLGDIEVIRGFAGSIFKHNERYNVYCPVTVDTTVFRVVYVNSGCELWIEQEISQKDDFSLQFQLFDAAVSWIHKIITIVQDFGCEIPDELCSWNIKFSLHTDQTVKPIPDPETVLSCFSNRFLSPVLFSNFSSAFIDGLRTEANYSEQSLVLALVSFICDFNQNTNPREVLNKIVESTSARHIHIFVAKSYRDFFSLERELPTYIEQTAEQNIKLNLGWKCRDRSEGNEIEGKEECKQYLNSMVAYIWENLKNKLKPLNREFLIYELLVNAEKADHQKERWKRTFKANLALQQDLDDLYSVVNKQIFLSNGASLTSRLVIEMAICESTVDGGKEAGVIDIQELMCLASLMHHLGSLSEAINYDAVAPKLVISSFGDILFAQDFHDNILMNYVYKLNDSSLSQSVNEYADNLLEQEPVETVNSYFEGEFTEAWIDEFGFTIDDARAFIDVIEDYGLSNKQLVYKVLYTDLLGMFESEKIDVVERIIHELVIFPRSSWVDIPPGFKPTDWQPWRFRRRFSLILRPIVQFDETNLLVSPSHIRTAFIYLVRSCHTASLDEEHFSSTLMKRWIGHTRKVNGLSFNTKVADKLRGLGWTVKEEIKITEVLNKKLPDLGDIDVLAWNQSSNIIAVIECKDLAFAKTEGEIARQLHDFKGVVKATGKNDRLLKHVHRLDTLRDNLDGLSKFTGIDIDLLEMKGYVVFSNVVPMVFNENRLQKDHVYFATFQQLDEWSL